MSMSVISCLTFSRQNGEKMASNCFYLNKSLFSRQNGVKMACSYSLNKYLVLRPEPIFISNFKSTNFLRYLSTVL